MSMKRFLLPLALLGWAMTALLAGPATADDITEAQVTAAKAAIAASGASRGYDDLLPAVAQAIQSQLIRLRPDVHQQITDVVDAEALKLVARRPELDTAIARIWAAQFTVEELQTITAFYQSDAGKKFLKIGPKVVSDSLQAARAWSDRVRAELLANAQATLKAQGVEF